MRRIDENTYIDDTLVTCAEYQLFIDEMREQGKYHQPDHWSSYQFPTGQAREPILGVRASDAEELCLWLTAREGGEWHYRVSTFLEATEYSIQSNLYKLPTGYWSRDANNRPGFFWIGNVPINARKIDRDLVLTSELDREFDRATQFTHDSDQHDSDEFANQLHFARDLDYVLEEFHAIEYANNRALDLDRTLALSRDLSIELSFSFGREHPLGLDRDHAITADIAIILHLANRLGQDRNPAYDPNKVKENFLDQALEVFADLITLQERIVGHSPAFEGIRLVKERIR